LLSTEDQASGLRGLRRPRPLRIVAITSGKGGVGKSNLAANFAVLAAGQGLSVLLIDAALGLSNADVLLGLQPPHHIGHLLDGSRTLSEVLTEGPCGVQLLSAGCGVEPLLDFDAPQRRRLLDELSVLEGRFDLVLIDSGAGLSGDVRFFVGAAQETMLVVSPEPTSLVNAYAALKILSAKATSRFHLVVNRAPDERAARTVFDALSKVSDRFLNAELRYLGSVPHDACLRRAVMSQRSVVELFPQSPASVAFRKLLAHFLSAPAPLARDGGLNLLWNRLLFTPAEADR
jgi:flagellar biosynthesis protein FlhG